MIEVELIRMSFTYKLIFAICVNKILVVLGKDKKFQNECTCTL